MKTEIANRNTMKRTITWIILLTVGVLSYKANAQSTTPDSVCSGAQDVVYGVLNPNSGSTYTWFLSDPAAGVIDNSIAPNDSIIQIDWSTTPGSYTLFLVETNITGCLGDTMSLDLIINPLPTIALAGDSVCSNNVSQVTATLTGQAPWIIDYTDGTNNYTDTASASPYVISLPPYSNTTSITVTSVTDGNSCTADPSALPATNVFIYPKPATASIYHY